MIPALLGAATIGASLYNSHMQAQSQRELRQSQLELYKRQRADTIDLMDRQNLYNSPSAQMDRLRDAGLNPHLIYSGGATNPSVSATPAAPPQLQPMGQYLDPSAFAQVAQMYYQSQGMQLQNEQLKLQNRGLEADVALKERQANLLGVQAETEASKKRNVDASTEYTQSQTDLNYQAYKLNTFLHPLELKYKELDYDLQKALSPIRRMSALLQNEKTRADINNANVLTQVESLFKRTQVKEAISRKDLNQQQYNFLDAVQDSRIEIEKLKERSEYWDVNAKSFKNNDAALIFSLFTDFVSSLLKK